MFHHVFAHFTKQVQDIALKFSLKKSELPFEGVSVLFMDEFSDGSSVETTVDMLIERCETHIVHGHITQRTNQLGFFFMYTSWVSL